MVLTSAPIAEDGEMSSPRAGGPSRRRSFTPAQKLHHLAEYETACENGQGGAYLRREGLYSSLGKAILAERPEAVPVDMPPPLTPRSHTTMAELRADLTETRRRGYAIDDEENTQGLRCFGFALRYDDPVRDAISCSVPLERLDPGHEAAIVAAMSGARSRIEESAPLVV